MPLTNWLWFDGDDESLSVDQRAFLERMRSLAAGWTWCTPEYTCTIVSEDHPEQLRLILDVPSRQEGRVAATVGVLYENGHIWCGEFHNQNYTPVRSKIVEILEGSGTPLELGEMAAGWMVDTSLAIQ